MLIRILPLTIILTALALVATACSAPAGSASINSSAGAAPTAAASTGDPSGAGQQPPTPVSSAALRLPGETRTDSAGEVTVEVTPGESAAGTLAFAVVMNTHSVELNQDLTQIATLKDDQGRTYPVEDSEGAAGGHHREGTLVFDVPPEADFQWIELNLSGIGDVPSRLFRWESK